MDRIRRWFFKSEQESSTQQFNPVSEDGSILVHPESKSPSRLWSSLKGKQNVDVVAPLSRDTPVNPRKVRFVCISDTHNKTSTIPEAVPDGDVLLHAGDFTMDGRPEQVEEFNGFLGSLPHKRKVVIAGNHNLTFDKNFIKNDTLLRGFGLESKKIQKYFEDKGLNQMSEVLTNCTDYLEDSSVEIYGIKIYGSPWQPRFNHVWGFNLERGQDCLDKWNMIPADTDVLVTHGPPLGHGDGCFFGGRSGCIELLNTVQYRVKPKYHVFGHIHEGYGRTTDGATQFINASTCTYPRYKPSNPPIIFDIPLPEGHNKE